MDVMPPDRPTAETPLMIAAKYGHDATVRALAEAGCDFNLTTTMPRVRRGDLPKRVDAADIAKQRGHRKTHDTILKQQRKRQRKHFERPAVTKRGLSTRRWSAVKTAALLASGAAAGGGGVDMLQDAPPPGPWGHPVPRSPLPAAAATATTAVKDDDLATASRSRSEGKRAHRAASATREGKQAMKERAREREKARERERQRERERVGARQQQQLRLNRQRRVVTQARRDMALRASAGEHDHIWRRQLRAQRAAERAERDHQRNGSSSETGRDEEKAGGSSKTQGASARESKGVASRRPSREGKSNSKARRSDERR